MIYSETMLGEILRNMYDHAPYNEQVLMIHLFGIKYGSIIEQHKFKVANIVTKSGINDSYKTEVNKGIRLGKYVQIKSEKDNF